MDVHRCWKGRFDEDGLLTDLYSYVWSVMDELRHFSIPDTILFEQGHPKVWYSWDPRPGATPYGRELKKLLGKDIAEEKIVNTFASQASGDILAEYSTYSMNPTSGQFELRFEYFDADGLRAFLSSRAAGASGVLQRFLYPKTVENSLLQGVWSTSCCFLSHRRNKQPLTSKVPVRERCVTFDGPPQFSAWGVVTPYTQKRVDRAFEELAAMLNRTEGITVAGVVAMLKVDCHGNLYMLNCTSTRTKRATVTGARNPIAMNMKFSTSTNLGADNVTVRLPSAVAHAARRRREAPSGRSHGEGSGATRTRSSFAASAAALKRSMLGLRSPSSSSGDEPTNGNDTQRTRGEKPIATRLRRALRCGVLTVDLNAVRAEELDFLHNVMAKSLRAESDAMQILSGQSTVFQVLVDAGPGTPAIVGTPLCAGAGSAATARALNHDAEEEEGNDAEGGDGGERGGSGGIRFSGHWPARSWATSGSVSFAPQAFVPSRASDTGTATAASPMPLTPFRLLPDNDLLAFERKALFEFLQDAVYHSVTFRNDSSSGGEGAGAPVGVWGTVTETTPDVRGSRFAAYKFMLPVGLREVMNQDRVAHLCAALGLGREYSFDIETGVRVDILFMRAPRPYTDEELLRVVLAVLPRRAPPMHGQRSHSQNYPLARSASSSSAHAGADIGTPLVPTTPFASLTDPSHRLGSSTDAAPGADAATSAVLEKTQRHVDGLVALSTKGSARPSAVSGGNSSASDDESDLSTTDGDSATESGRWPEALRASWDGSHAAGPTSEEVPAGAGAGQPSDLSGTPAITPASPPTRTTLASVRGQRPRGGRPPRHSKVRPGGASAALVVAPPPHGCQPEQQQQRHRRSMRAPRKPVCEFKADWRLESGFPTPPPAPDAHRRRRPLSWSQREESCELSCFRRLILLGPRSCQHRTASREDGTGSSGSGGEQLSRPLQSTVREQSDTGETPWERERRERMMRLKGSNDLRRAAVRHKLAALPPALQFWIQ